MKGRITAIVVATLCALATCEVAARIMFPRPPDPTRQPQIKYRFDREVRYVPLPNQHGWIDDGFVTTNSRGFRGSDPATPKPASRYRIVAVGDSVTFGFGVGDSETFCAQIEQLLRSRMPGADFDVVNLAVPGFDTRQEVALLTRYLDALRPDLVLVGLYSNDIPDSLEDGEGGTTVAAGSASADRVLQMNPVPTSWWAIQMRRSRAAYVVGRAMRRFAKSGEWGMARFTMELDMLEGRQSPQLDRAWGNVDRQFARLQDLASTNHFVTGVVVLPPREQVVGLYPHADYQTHVRTLAERHGFFIIDPLPALAASKTPKDELYIPYDRNHPSAAGHRLIAQAVADDLAGDGLLPDRRVAKGLH